MSKKQKTLNKLTEGLVNLPSIDHKRPKEPIKEELNKKFIMIIGNNGKLEMKDMKNDE